MAFMKMRISIIGLLTVALLASVGCSTTENSKMRNKNRPTAYQQQTKPGLEPVAEAPAAGRTSWGGNFGPY